MGEFATPGGLLGTRVHKASFMLAALLAMELAAGVAVAGAAPVRITAGHIQFEGYSLERVSAQLDDTGATITIEKIGLAGEPEMVLHDVTLHCPRFEAGADDSCPAGTWSLAMQHVTDGWRLPLNGVLDQLALAGGDGNLLSSVNSGELAATLNARLEGGRVDAALDWSAQAVTGLPDISLFPQALHWVTTGVSRGTMRLLAAPSVATVIRYDLEFAGLGFDSPDGRFAAEELAMHCAGAITLGDTVEAGMVAEITGGAILLDNFYTSFDSNRLSLRSQLQMTGSRLHVSQLELSDGNALVLEARASLDMDQADAVIDYRVDRLDLQFPQAYERYIESMVSAATLDGLAVTGSLTWKGAGPAGLAGAGVLDVKDLSIVDTKRGRFAVTGLEAHVIASAQQPGSDTSSRFGPDEQALESHISWRGLLLQKINLGAGKTKLSARPGHFSLAEPLHLEVLGGQLALDELQVNLPDGKAAAGVVPDIRLFASLQDLDMAQLSQALGWPSFSGTVSGEIPGVTLHEGVLAVEGQIEFKVFSGQVLLSGLRIERPFGVLPSLAANLEARDLDLLQLTQTFSFGQISGQMSGYVHDLRMLDWKPVAFDAWFGTPAEEKGSHDISRQAVNHLTTIGGGSATTALAGPVMKLFNNFSYRRLGLGCRLSNNTCEVRGLDDDSVSVLIMEGAGVPKIMIRAYNRQMHWPSMVGGLTAASQGESIRVGDPP